MERGFAAFYDRPSQLNPGVSRTTHSVRIRSLSRPWPLRAVSIMALALGLMACPRQTAVWIVGQEVPGRPVFGIGKIPRGQLTYLGYFLVAPCEGFDGTSRNATWSISGTDETRDLARITYGRVPVGYVASARYGGMSSPNTFVVPPLTPGCYVANTDGSGHVRFRVGPDGSVLEEPRQSSDDAAAG